MANEVRGILYEAIAEVALQKAVEIAGIPGKVRWNEKPDEMSINPDFTIGLNKDSPSHIVLVTASGSAKETDKKFWRNMGELYEVKAQLATNPIVINLYFKSVVKLGLDNVTQKLSDFTFHVETKSYYVQLESWVNESTTIAGKTKEQKQQLLVNKLKSDSLFQQSLHELAKDLAIALQQRNVELDSLWELMREDYERPHHAPTAKTTSVRRGLGKLMVLEPEIRQKLYVQETSNSRIDPDDLPEYPFELGLLRKTVAGVQIADPEIQRALDLLGHETSEIILQQAPTSMNIWINPLRDLGRVSTHVDFIYQHYDKITQADKLTTLLSECFNNPSGLSGEDGDEKVWIYEIMISLLKAQSERLQGYGLAQLAVDTGLLETGEGAPLARFIIPKFTQREVMLSIEHLRMLAIGLAHRFQSNIKLGDIPRLKAKVKDWVIKENLEDRLIPYRNFEPLLWLLEAELKKQGKAYEPKQAYVGWVNEYAEVGKRSATTPFVKVGTTLIHWKSSYASHPNDKTKELSARARSIKYQYHINTKTFTRRSGVSQLALIVDGDWKDRHLQTLSSSGWDIIVYPDEISQLVSQL